jgi:hypothetical protein
MDHSSSQINRQFNRIEKLKNTSIQRAGLENRLTKDEIIVIRSTMDTLRFCNLNSEQKIRFEKLLRWINAERKW